MNNKSFNDYLKGRYGIIFISLLLLPLLFINLKDSHDWGDDFAQYLIQARNINEGRPQTDNGLLINEIDPAYAIDAYPIGFPLLIAPIYFLSKLHILPYCILISILLFMTGLFSFEYFRSRTNIFMAILITILFCYNPNIVYLKKQILSEIPFTCLFMFALLWPETPVYNKKYSWIITGLLFSFLVSIRLAGLVVIAGYFLFELNQLRKEKGNNPGKFPKLILLLVSTVGVFYLLNGLMFPINIGGLFGFYSTALQTHEIHFSENLNFYYTVAKYIFPFYGGWIPSFWILFAFTGWFIRFIKSPSFCEYAFPLYFILILFYPYANAGVRFLIPVLPLLIFYSGFFIYWLFSWSGEKAKWISTIILLIPLSAYPGQVMGLARAIMVISLLKKFFQALYANGCLQGYIPMQELE